MKYLIISIVVFASSIIFPQQNQENYKTIALSFEVYALSLRDYYGGLGGKVWLNDNLTMIASIGGRLNSSNRELDRSEYNREVNSKGSSISAAIGIENHFELWDDISAFIPLRTTYRFGHNSEESSIDTSDTVYETEFQTQSINLEFGLGFELWLTKRISIAGQHLINLYHSWGHDDSSYTTFNIIKFSEYGIRSGTSALILSVYF